MELELSTIGLEALLTGSMTMVEEKALKHRIELLSDFADIPQEIIADERKLKQIMFNLLSNAVKFVPDGGKVTLGARTANAAVSPGRRQSDGREFRLIADPAGQGDAESTGNNTCIEVSVSDNGIGIGAEHLDRIFNPFEQADGSTSRRYGGTGLGLSLTKSLVDLHGGRIWAESEGEGKGSRFCFVIPV